MTRKISVLVVSRGHAFDRNAFFAMFEDMDDLLVTHVEHPAAAMVIQPDNLASFDTVLFYDMVGIPGLATPGCADATGQPTPGYRRSIEALLEKGTGLVLLNHATVSWPEWPLWREITGSSFMLRSGTLGGVQVPGSGYRGGHGPHPNATFQLEPATTHPVLEGLAGGFEITDELYLKTAEFERRVQPLLRADYRFAAENFTPPPLAPAEEQAQWQHPDGSNLLVWINACRASPAVVSELGDGPAAFGNPAFRRFLHNALRWSASEDARRWALARSSQVPSS